MSQDILDHGGDIGSPPQNPLTMYTRLPCAQTIVLRPIAPYMMALDIEMIFRGKSVRQVEGNDRPKRSVRSSSRGGLDAEPGLNTITGISTVGIQRMGDIDNYFKA